MKLFEVICEYCNEDFEIVSERQFVTADDDSFQAVVNHFINHCQEYEKDLKSVKEVLTIVQHLRREDYD